MHLKTIATFLIVLALAAGMVGCNPGPIQYNLTISVIGGGEVVTPGEGTSTYDEGKVVEIIVFPHTGYDFVNWTGDVETLGDINSASTTITMNGTYQITANFE